MSDSLGLDSVRLKGATLSSTRRPGGRQFWRSAPLTVGLLFCLGNAASADAPPVDAIPMSQIAAAIESVDGFGYFEEIEWDDDGYWEVEYRDTEGRRVKTKIDPISGESIDR